MDAPPVAPPVISVPAAERAVPVIIEWRAGIVRCGAKTLEPERIEAPFSLPSVSFPGSLQIFKPIGVLFDVDARGRAINVAPELERSGDAWDSSDAEAAVAGSQFRAGPPVAGCRVAYTPQTIEVAEASVESLAGVVSGPYARGATLAYRKRMIALGATCMITPVIARTASFPNPDLLPGPPGSFVRYAYRYDIDANGRVVNMKAVFPTQLADKGDSEMRRALAASTFAPEARSGCYSGVGGAGSPSQAPTRPADSSS